MSDQNDHIDLLAGEYALGLLEGQERIDAAHRAETDPAFAARVAFWNERFAALLGSLEERPAPAALKSRIEAEIFGAAAPRRSASRTGLWDTMFFWRGMAGAGFALAAIAFTTLLVRPPEIIERVETIEIAAPAPAPAPGVVLVAALQRVDLDPAVLAIYDESENLLTLEGEVGVGQPGDTELWLIPSGQNPVSLGVIPRSGARSVPVPPQLYSEFQAGSALAVSLEPEGGSPTGAPTGPILVLGALSRA